MDTCIKVKLHPQDHQDVLHDLTMEFVHDDYDFFISL